MLCTKRSDIVEAIEFTGANYSEIYKAWPNCRVEFKDGDTLSLQKWVVELGGFSPFDDSPVALLIENTDTGCTERVYSHNMLVISHINNKAACFTTEEFKAKYEPLNAI